MLQKKFIAKWKDAAETKDVARLGALLADSATLVSPVAFKAITEKGEILAIFKALVQVLPDITYTRAESMETGAIMIFEGSIAGTALKVEGIDVFTLGLDGRVMDLKVFVRPLKAANAFAEAMAKALASFAPLPQ